MSARVGMLAVVAFTGLCFFTCTGCVSLMRGWNPWASRETKQSESHRDSKITSSEKKILKRPTISDEPKSEAPEGPRSSVKVSSKGVGDDKDSGSKDKANSKSATQVGAGAQSGQDASSTSSKKKTTHTASAKSDEIPDTKAGNSDAESEGAEKGPRKFEKHDHLAYVERIKSKADELLKKQPDCTLARLCRHTITDEWTLQLYVRHPKSFSFVVYSWDEIDEKWEQSYESETRPGSQWEHHLRFASAHKECSDIKQNQR